MSKPFRVNPSLQDKPTLVDANIFLRYLLVDDREKAERCRLLFERTVAGEETLFTTPLVMAEVVWVLERYHWERGKIARNLGLLLNTPHLRFEQRKILEGAVSLYAEHAIDFIDAYHAALLQERGERRLYSYDEDFDKIAGLERVEP